MSVVVAQRVCVTTRPSADVSDRTSEYPTAGSLLYTKNSVASAYVIGPMARLFTRLALTQAR